MITFLLVEQPWLHWVCLLYGSCKCWWFWGKQIDFAISTRRFSWWIDLFVTVSLNFLFLFYNLKFEHLRMAFKGNKMCSSNPNYLLTQTKKIAHAKHTFPALYIVQLIMLNANCQNIKIVNFTKVTSSHAHITEHNLQMTYNWSGFGCAKVKISTWMIFNQMQILQCIIRVFKCALVNFPGASMCYLTIDKI